MSLTIAIPSKGRLKDNTIQMIKAAGMDLQMPENARSYQGKLTAKDAGISADIAFLSASEIARELLNGTVHAGITGEDLARESVHAADRYLDFTQPLGLATRTWFWPFRGRGSMWKPWLIWMMSLPNFEPDMADACGLRPNTGG